TAADRVVIGQPPRAKGLEKKQHRRVGPGGAPRASHRSVRAQRGIQLVKSRLRGPLCNPPPFREQGAEARCPRLVARHRLRAPASLSLCRVRPGRVPRPSTVLRRTPTPVTPSHRTRVLARRYPRCAGGFAPPWPGAATAARGFSGSATTPA